MIEPASIKAALAILLPSIEEHRRSSKRPFVLGLSGLQGSGKSTWAATLSNCLSQDHGYNTRALSIDDLYRDHDDLTALRNNYPENRLLRTRGQPGTHDEALAKRFFAELMGEMTGKDPRKDPKHNGSQAIIRWPSYDKSLHGGQGGRVPEDRWERVSLDLPLDILIFEGWCLGFQPLTDAEVTERWEQAMATRIDNSASKEDTKSIFSTRTLTDHRLEDLQLINENLRRYCDTFAGPWRFDGFLHLNTEDLSNVYRWRMDQERELRKRGPGMSDSEVVEFVKRYMPSYELFLDHLQKGSLFHDIEGAHRKHVRITLDSERRVTSVAVI